VPEERITGSKTDLDLSVGSTITRVYTVMLTFFMHRRNLAIRSELVAFSPMSSRVDTSFFCKSKSDNIPNSLELT